ncbi:MAG TPA: hypothetical protein VFM54_18925 [Micromonosporaceae bacterium]|nr:hypothetical protein [Micromonosporaceae bacterium]
MKVRTRTLLGVVLVLTLVTGLGLFLGLRTADVKLPDVRLYACTVQAEGTVTLDWEQMANSATIAAVGIRRGLPERAVVVALATALQESKLRNLSGGDRDSVGLFQQRPSQGWGTPEQIRDPRYSAGRFYTALLRVRGWQEMRVTDAAQAVQRSAYPQAYERWADESTVLTTALLGHASGAVACSLPDPELRGEAAAAALGNHLQLDWGDATTASGGGPELTLAVSGTRSGWQYAHWLVSHAANVGVIRVAFEDREWTAKSGAWTRVKGPSTPRVVAEVHADS